MHSVSEISCVCFHFSDASKSRVETQQSVVGSLSTSTRTGTPTGRAVSPRLIQSLPSVTFQADKSDNRRQSRGSGRRKRNEVRDTLGGSKETRGCESQTDISRSASGGSFHGAVHRNVNRSEGLSASRDNDFSKDVIKCLDEGRDVVGHLDKNKDVSYSDKNKDIDHLDESKEVVGYPNKSKDTIGYSDKSKDAAGYLNESKDVIGQVADTGNASSSGTNEDKEGDRNNSNVLLGGRHGQQDVVGHGAGKQDSDFQSKSLHSVQEGMTNEDFKAEGQRNGSRGLTGCEGVKDGSSNCDAEVPATSPSTDCCITISPIKPVKVGAFVALFASDTSDDTSCVSDSTADLLIAAAPLCDISDLASLEDEGQGESSDQGVAADVSGNVEDSLNQGNGSPSATRLKSMETKELCVSGVMFESKVISGMDHFQFHHFD